MLTGIVIGVFSSVVNWQTNADSSGKARLFLCTTAATFPYKLAVLPTEDYAICRLDLGQL